MKAYRTEVTLDEPSRIVLEGVPFRQGQRVAILVVPRTGPDGITALKNLFHTTQSLPHVQSITDDEIAAEVEAYRKGQ